VLQHGTVIVDSDLGLMMRVIRQRPGKPRSVDGMTSIARESARKVDKDEVKAALVAGFEKAFGVMIQKGALSDDERELAKRLSEEKYGKEVFTFQR
jgi:lipoate-protein ligase A